MNLDFCPERQPECKQIEKVLKLKNRLGVQASYAKDYCVILSAYSKWFVTINTNQRSKTKYLFFSYHSFTVLFRHIILNFKENNAWCKAPESWFFWFSEFQNFNHNFNQNFNQNFHQNQNLNFDINRMKLLWEFLDFSFLEFFI